MNPRVRLHSGSAKHQLWGQVEAVLQVWARGCFLAVPPGSALPDQPPWHWLSAGSMPCPALPFSLPWRNTFAPKHWVLEPSEGWMSGVMKGVMWSMVEGMHRLGDPRSSSCRGTGALSLRQD